MTVTNEHVEVGEAGICPDCGDPWTCPHCAKPMVHHDMFGMAWCPELYWGPEDE